MEQLTTRRDFIKKMTAASLAASTATIPMASFLSACTSPKIPSSADTVILLWMAGGMAHTETFDPKAYAPYEKGMESKRMLSTFPKIPTVVDGLDFSKGLESIAGVMDKGAIIRSYQSADLGHILHTPATSTIGTPATSHHNQYKPHTLAPGLPKNWGR
jgi:hypothetical protein